MAKPARAAGIAKVDASLMRFWVPVEVRYSDLDVQGHVNNAAFFTYFEQGRVAFFAQLRTTSQTLLPASDTANKAGSKVPSAIAPDLPFVIATATCSYMRPISRLAPVAVGVRSSRVTHAAIEMEYAVCDQPSGIIYATGTTLTVSVDPGSGRPRPLPAWARSALEQ